MINVICDTSFLIHLATKRIKNLDNLVVEIGSINFLVPEVVKYELEKLINNSEKKSKISMTIDYIQKFETIPITGKFADEELFNYATTHSIVLATLDKELKKKIRKLGKSIMTIHNDKILFEN